MRETAPIYGLSSTVCFLSLSLSLLCCTYISPKVHGSSRAVDLQSCNRKKSISPYLTQKVDILYLDGIYNSLFATLSIVCTTVSLWFALQVEKLGIKNHAFGLSPSIWFIILLSRRCWIFGPRLLRRQRRRCQPASHCLHCRPTFPFETFFYPLVRYCSRSARTKKAAEAYSALIGASPGLRSSVAIADQDQSKNTQKKLYEIFVKAEALDNLFSRSC